MSGRKGLALLLTSLAAGCIADRPLPVTDDLSAPVAYVRPICSRFEYQGVPNDAHWDGRAAMVWASDEDVIVGVDCSLTSLSAGLVTLEERIDIRDPTARHLRTFLSQNGIAVLPTVSP
jgi:hypothetical protein